MYYQIDNNGFFLGVAKPTNDMEFYTEVPISGNFIKFKFNGTEWVEGATAEEIAEANKAIVPQEVQLWRVRTVLRLMDLETTIETALESLEEPTKTGAKTIWEYGTTIERQNQTVLFLQYVLEMTDEQIDEIFIQSEAIVI